MKNLIDELHELENYNYDVSNDFSEKVMKKIKKDKNKASYAVSILTTGAIACLAILVCTNSNIRNKFTNISKDSNIESITQDISAEGINNQEMILNEKDQLNKGYSDDMTDSVALENYEEKLSADEYKNQGVINAPSSTAPLRGNYGDYKEIIKILENSALSVVAKENVLTVKATKEKVENLLRDYKELEIEAEGEFVTIKF